MKSAAFLTAPGRTLLLVLVVLVGVFHSISAFRVSLLRHEKRPSSRSPPSQTTTSLYDSQSDPTVAAARVDGSCYANADFLEFSVFPHRPLGCTIEESLASELAKTGKHHVFVSKLTPDGAAEKAGLQLGDVIVGVSGLFGDIMDNVTYAGIDKVKGLIQGRPEDEPLEVRVARGTTVLQEHERALVELCSDPTLDATDSDECVLEYLKDSYEINGDSGDVEPNGINGDDGEDAMVDDEDMVGNLYSMWADDLPIEKAKPLPTLEEPSKPQVKPWSSRSSPSGTWVRDPTTGKMRNIDK